MKVSLIYCAVGIAGFNPNRPMGDREGSWIGHGIASVAAATRSYGHDVDMIDLRQLSGWEQFAEIIKSNPADVYGLSVAPVDHASALMAVLQIKTHLPDSKVIIGGIHPSIFPEQYDYKVIDTVVIGEGEVTFPKLLNDIGNLPKKIKGIKPNLNAIPWVDRESFDYSREMACNFAPDQKLPSITMIAGRGCPYKCAYCQPAENAVFGKPYRMRSPQDVVMELSHLHDLYGYKSITFWDDTFTVNRRWCLQFAELYEKTNIRASIAACSRADIICHNEDMVARLAEVGVDWFVIGFETGTQRMLDFIDKGTTVEQNYQAAAICRKNGIKIFATHMYGLPTETREEAQATAHMMDSIQPELASPFWYVPIPGTKLYDYCKKNDIILNENDDISRTGHFRPTLKGIDYDLLSTILEQRNYRVNPMPETKVAA